jgi:hypothetical protein
MPIFDKFPYSLRSQGDKNRALKSGKICYYIFQAQQSEGVGKGTVTNMRKTYAMLNRIFVSPNNFVNSDQ